jgi:hypothetical protein
MAIEAGGIKIEETEIDWGVRIWSDGGAHVVDVGSEDLARLWAMVSGGELVCRQVLVGAWADAPQ